MAGGLEGAPSPSIDSSLPTLNKNETFTFFIIIQQINTSQMLVFDESGKLEYPGKNLSEQS